jgi:hypothetical protein
MTLEAPPRAKLNAKELSKVKEYLETIDPRDADFFDMFFFHEVSCENIVKVFTLTPSEEVEALCPKWQYSTLPPEKVYPPVTLELVERSISLTWAWIATLLSNPLT